MRTIELPPSVLGEALRDADVLKNHSYYYKYERDRYGAVQVP